MADGTIVQVLRNMRGGMGKKSRKQFDAVKKDELMEQFEKDLGSGAVDALSEMETTSRCKNC